MHLAQSVSNPRDNRNKFLAIEVAGRGFGISTSSVREIVNYAKINALPQTPDFVRGVTLVRQETIPVLDLNILLGGKELTPLHSESCFIVLQLTDNTGKPTQLCLLADHILQTYKITRDSIDKPPSVGDKTIVNYLQGVARIEEQVFILIDPASLITPYLETISPYVSYDDAISKPGSDEKSNIGQRVNTGDKKKNKFLSVFIADSEYAFPLSSVSQIIDKSALDNFIDQDIPDILDGAAVFNDKLLGIIKLSNFITPQQNLNESNNNSPAKHAEQLHHSREVLVLIEFHDGFLGIAVDRIGHTYQSSNALKQNSFCTDLQRSRIQSLGFIDNDNISIEVIDPIGLLTKSELSIVSSWMHCIDRIVTTTDEDKPISTKNQEEECNNPYSKFAGSYLIVQVGEELIGLNNTEVDEVLSYSQFIPFLGGPAWFSGLLDLRGNTYPVIDLHVKFDIPQKEITQDARKVLVMVKHGAQKIGLLVDAIINSSPLGTKKFHGLEKAKLFINSEAMHAVAIIELGVVHIINLHQLIEASEISARRLLEELNQQSEKINIETPAF